MNENLDLTKILDGCPVGTKFYSTIYGKVDFSRVISDDSTRYPIEIMVYNEATHSIELWYCEKDGKFSSSYEGECTLFPSEDQRDWSKFERFWDKQNVEKFDPNTLQPFDRVLVKDYRNDAWVACLFSHKANNSDDGWFICDNTYWNYVIPYNDDTKHLVGTKEDCPEYYKWWEE